MLRFLGSLKTRTAAATAAVIAVLLLLNGVCLLLLRSAEQRAEVESRARLLAALTHADLAQAWARAGDAQGRAEFETQVRRVLLLEPHVERLRVIDTAGQVLFDSTESDTSAGRSVEPAVRDAVRAWQPRELSAAGPDGRARLEIVTPLPGRHLALAYRVRYDAPRRGLRLLASAALALLALSVLCSALLAVLLAQRITRPIGELTRGAQRIAEGHFDQRLEIWSGDEMQLLAEAFNHMAARLKENVEQLEHSNRKLAEVNEELKELDRLKSDLLANVSHELRTPLTAIKGYTDYMLDRKLGPVSDKQEKGLLVMQRNLERLSRSIGALLDFSRMDMGHVALRIQPFALAPLLEQIVTTLKAELERKRLSFTASVDPHLAPVIGDRERLSQVFENLIINAVKFTPDGGHIAVGAARGGREGRPVAEIRVRDTGIGIPAGQLDKIFQRFHQVDGSSTRRYGGVGLGLSIVKIILDAHGAPVSVHSEVGRGTEFRFELPLAERSLPREERPPAEAAPATAITTAAAGDDEARRRDPS